MPRATFVWATAPMPSFRNLMYAYLQPLLEEVLVWGAGGFVAQQLGTGKGDGLL
jgi:hypothetical protein